MIRRTRPLHLACAAVLLAAPGVGLADDAKKPAFVKRQPPAEAPAAIQEDAENWPARLEAGAQELTAARAAVQDLEQQLRNARQRRYPRGAAREKLRQDLARAQAVLDEAERYFPELLDEARRDGVPAGTLYPYEQLLRS